MVSDPTGSNPPLPLLGDPTVAKALIDNQSHSRALKLLRKQPESEPIRSDKDFQKQLALLYPNQKQRQYLTPQTLEEFKRLHAPTTYIVNYYVWDDIAKPTPDKLVEAFSSSKRDIVLNSKGEQVSAPYIRSDNPAEPISVELAQMIHQSLANISALLPGQQGDPPRIQFREVDNPQNADITYAAIPRSIKMAGVTRISEGYVLLSTSNAKISKDTAQNTITHETLHALGLAHPHNLQKDGDIHVENAAFTQTVLTYATNNNTNLENGINDKKFGLPTTLMGADIAALLTLYPIASDKHSMPQLGRVQNVQDVCNVTVQTATTKLERLKIGEGVQPFYRKDTNNDTLTIGAECMADLQQLKGGTLVRLGDQNSNNTVHMPVHFETIHVTRQAQKIGLNGNVAIHIDDRDLPLSVSSSGRNNTIYASFAAASMLTINADEARQQAAADTAKQAKKPVAVNASNVKEPVTITITDPDAVMNATRYDLVRSIWGMIGSAVTTPLGASVVDYMGLDFLNSYSLKTTKLAGGLYRVELHQGDDTVLNTVNLRLASPHPQAQANFEVAMDVAPSETRAPATMSSVPVVFPPSVNAAPIR